MNLINNIWIPVIRKSGARAKISPWQITDKIKKDPIERIASVRPDFDGALIQFIIGLLQTACPPTGTAAWRRWYKHPPTPKQLKKQFDKVAHAFDLDTEGARFMQDLTLGSEPKFVIDPIERLLVDAPGKQTVVMNADIFVKRNRVGIMCDECVAKALLTMQLTGPEGGSGIKAGLRGGGPVTTIAVQDNLWKTAWFNVLNKNTFDKLGNARKSKDTDKFPWLAKTRTSANDFQTAAKDINAAQIYWPMPRKYRVVFERSDAPLVCDLCGEKTNNFSREYLKTTNGVKYENRIIHPLTPVYKQKDKGKKGIFAVHQHEAIGYKHWAGFVLNTVISDDSRHRRAMVVDTIFDRGFDEFRLWAFGYDMKQAKARCWYEGVMPVFVSLKQNKIPGDYKGNIESIVRAAEYVSEKLNYATRSALSVESIPTSSVARYWNETESDFYQMLREMRKKTKNKNAKMLLKERWHKILIQKAEQIFNGMFPIKDIKDVEMKGVADAWNNMRKAIYGGEIRAILGFPKKEKADGVSGERI